MANSDKATSLLAFESVLGLQTLSCVLKSGTVVAIWLPEKMAYQRVLVSHRFHGSFGCMGRILASDLQVMSLIFSSLRPLIIIVVFDCRDERQTSGHVHTPHQSETVDY